MTAHLTSSVLLSALASLPVLAACSAEPAAAPPSDPVLEDHRLAGVNLAQPLRVMGNEPFWHIDISPRSISFGGPDQPEYRAANEGPILMGTTATWLSQTQGGVSIKITLTATDCSDGMSDRIYPLSALVEVDETTFNGCAASLQAFERSGESGRVE